MEIYKEFTFDAAHYLPTAPEGHKCRNMHGHTYRVKFFIRGQVDPETGWIIDFGEVKAAFKPLEKQLDHRLLNEVPGLEIPTVENIVRWIWRKMKVSLPGLYRIELQETPTSGVVYQGEFDQDLEVTHKTVQYNGKPLSQP